MARWTCPHCDREFDRAGQSHTCAPGGTVEDSFAGKPPGQLDAFWAVLDYLETLGDVHVDAVGVGVFLRSDRKVAELRPKARGLAVYLLLSRHLDSPRITRAERVSANRMMYVVRLQGPDDVDDELRSWLAAAYDEATDP